MPLEHFLLVQNCYLYGCEKFIDMTRQAIIERTIKAINQLPEEKAEEISDFADFVTKRHEEHLLTQGIQKLTSDSKTFDFLHNEEDLYSVDDLKEVYNG
jgi:hypothetical protein